MNLGNVRLILQREVRDQLRDRRTLFMIAVLPLLLYPLLGMSFLQVAQFMREQETRVLVIGESNQPGVPPLTVDQRFAEVLFGHGIDPQLRRLLLVDVRPDSAAHAPPDQGFAAAQQEMSAGGYETLVYLPSDFSGRLAGFRQALARRDDPAKNQSFVVPSPKVAFNASKQKSQITERRVRGVLESWIESIGAQNLRDNKLPEAAARPFEIVTVDMAPPHQRKAAVWSMILPFVLLIWALTGAFYPAVDLCAGEKERGTLETLLSSPAERNEIVWGKLLTVMCFSMATALLNLISMSITGSLVLGVVQPGGAELGAPPAISILWLLLALPPVSALFSALCLALAAFARSTKEGQYYLMPLVLIIMPLTILPMSPAVELNFGNSLIPITGVVLLLRSMLEGEYWAALPYIPLVCGTTLVCCLVAVRWAADQFNKESVLFRESERFDLSLWLRQLLRDREDTPTVAAAVFCGVLILLVHFFMSMAVARLGPSVDILSLAAVSQLAVVLTPALLMTIMLTRSPRKTLLLRMPNLKAIPAVIALAVCIQPVVRLFGTLVVKAYPVSDAVEKKLQEITSNSNHGLLTTLFMVALLPAVCEELAFRGFILSGLRHSGHKFRAIALASIFFGLTHSILQQSIVTCFTGLVIGYIAVQTGSLLPCALYHFTSNLLNVLLGGLKPESVVNQPWLAWFLRPEALSRDNHDLLIYQPGAIVLGALLSCALLYWFRWLPYTPTREEVLQQALDHQSAPPSLSSAPSSQTVSRS